MRGSAMEHAVPEKVFSTKDNPAKGISAVKAISLAAQAGQTIWRISQDNLNSALSAINLDNDIETEIRNAVNAGKLAYTHEAPVKFGIGTNAGYIMLDPNTGAGAYKIANGANGGWIELVQFLLVFALFSFVIINGAILAASVWGLLGAAWSLITFFLWVSSIKQSDSYEDFNKSNAVAALLLGGGLLISLIGAVGGPTLGLLVLLEGIGLIDFFASL